MFSITEEELRAIISNKGSNFPYSFQSSGTKTDEETFERNGKIFYVYYILNRDMAMDIDHEKFASLCEKDISKELASTTSEKYIQTSVNVIKKTFNTRSCFIRTHTTIVFALVGKIISRENEIANIFDNREKLQDTVQCRHIENIPFMIFKAQIV